MMLASSDETRARQRGDPRRRPVALPLRRRRQPARRLLRRRHGRQHARRRLAAPPGATANSPTATSGSRRAAARTSRPTRPTGRSSTSSAASTPTPAAPAARGAGNGGEIAYVPHKGESFLGLATQRGRSRRRRASSAATRARSWRTRVIQGSDLRARFAAGEMPQDLDELKGNELDIGGKPDGFPVGDDDVLYWNWLAPGGYGDPLTRDPEKVARRRRGRRGQPAGGRRRLRGEARRRAAASTTRRRRSSASASCSNGCTTAAPSATRLAPAVEVAGGRRVDRRRLPGRPRRGRLPLPPLRDRRSARSTATRSWRWRARAADPQSLDAELPRPGAVRRRRGRLPRVLLPRLRGAAGDRNGLSRRRPVPRAAPGA